MFTKLADKGIEVRGFDMRSFGRSEPNPKQRGKIEVFSDMVDDLEDFYTAASGTRNDLLTRFPTSASFSAEISVTSPQKSFIFIVQKKIFWI